LALALLTTSTVVHSVLDPAEVEAIRKKLAPKALGPLAAPPIEPTPIPIISDDHAGTVARPEALRVVNGWVPHMIKLVRRSITTPLAVGVIDASTVDGSALRDELEGGWLRFAGGGKKDDALVIAFGGAIIEHVAARLLGARDEDGSPEASPRRRSTSHVGRMLFSKVGDVAASSLASHWKEQLGVDLSLVSSESEVAELRRSLFGRDVLVCASVEFTAPVGGRLSVAGAPQAFLHRAQGPALAISRDAAETALGSVPVEVSVELGRALSTLRQIAELQPGSFIELSSTVDTPLPIRVEGVPCAFGRPVVSNGTVAVEVLTVGGKHVG
jgi:flagellar motor switch/type III secretory pathway protein FliN